MTAILKNDVPSVDLGTASGCEAAVKSSVVKIDQGRAKVALNGYVLGLATVELEHTYGEQRNDVASRNGVSAGQLTKTCTVAETLRDVNAQDHLVAWWGAHWDENPTVEHDTFHEVAERMLEGDGPSIVTFYQVFGAPSSAYDIIRGKRIHPSAVIDDDSDTESGDDESESDEPTPWQDRLAAMVAQAKLEGATPSEIVKVVNDTLKS